MIWKTKTHEYTATVCQKTGKPCPALARMARALAEATASAKPVTTDAFEIEGSSDLSHCAAGCTARFRAHPAQIRVFCDTDPDVSTDQLDGYADMMFGTVFTTRPAGFLVNPPCAMLEVSALAPRAASNEHRAGA